jgi:hypothetical protein
MSAVRAVTELAGGLGILSAPALETFDHDSQAQTG